MKRRLFIGVISDTHGLVREEALDALRGAHLVIHAGDIGGAAVLEELRAIAPVVAVRGNTDGGPFGLSLPVAETVESQQGLIYALHNLQQLDLDPVAAGFAAVISGHTHEPEVRRSGGVLYLNPGSAGPKRFKLPVSVARLFVDRDELDAEIVLL